MIKKYLVDRFLRWRLPSDFRPDAGINFTPPDKLYPLVQNPSHLWPVGTNLLTATQAEEMLEYVVGEEIDKLTRELEEANKMRNFFKKHALGPMLPPSCLVCGQITSIPAIKHAELPGIVVCEKCRDAALKEKP